MCSSDLSYYLVSSYNRYNFNSATNLYESNNNGSFIKIGNSYYAVSMTRYNVAIQPNYNDSMTSNGVHIVDHTSPNINTNLMDKDGNIDTSNNYIRNTTGSYVKIKMSDTGGSKLKSYKYILVPGIQNAVINSLEYEIIDNTLTYNGYFVANVGKLFMYKGKTYVIVGTNIKE